MIYGQVQTSQLFIDKSHCHLIIVGIDHNQGVLCYEHPFEIIEYQAECMKVRLRYEGQHPLMNLSTIQFVELSVRDHGAPYFSYVKVMEHRISADNCTLTLELPEKLNCYDNRRFKRLYFPEGVEMTCSINGLRGKSTFRGTPFTANMIDICGGGVSFVTKVKLFHPLYLQVKFLLPGWSETLEISGEIARITPYQQGLNRVAFTFREISDSLVQQIDDYCIKHSD